MLTLQPNKKNWNHLSTTTQEALKSLIYSTTIQESLKTFLYFQKGFIVDSEYNEAFLMWSKIFYNHKKTERPLPYMYTRNFKIIILQP